MSEEKEEQPVQAINRVAVDAVNETKGNEAWRTKADGSINSLSIEEKGDEAGSTKADGAINKTPDTSERPVDNTAKKAISPATYVRGFIELLSKQNDSYRFGSGDRSDVVKTEKILAQYLKDNGLEPVDKNWIKLTNSDYRESWRSNS